MGFEKSFRVLGVLGLAAGAVLCRMSDQSSGRYAARGLLAAGTAAFFLPEAFRAAASAAGSIADSAYRKHEIRSLEREMNEYSANLY